MTATCITQHTAFITCDGTGQEDSSLVLGPEATFEDAFQHITDHGAVCTGLGDASADPVVPATCQAKVFTDYRWQDVIIGP